MRKYVNSHTKILPSGFHTINISNTEFKTAISLFLKLALGRTDFNDQ